MKTWMLFMLFATIFCKSIYAAPLNIPAKIEQMRKNEQVRIGGWADNTGVYVISLVNVPITEKVNAAEAAEIALANGKKEIAAFLGQEMSSSSESTTEETTNNDKTELKEFYKSVKRIDVNQFLRGVVLYQVQTAGNELQAVCLVTGKTIDMSNELQAKIAELPPGTVGAVGIAIIIDNRTDLAKTQALNAALRLAIEQVLGTTVAATTQVQDNEKVRAKIFSHAAGFVDEYRVVEDGVANGNYRTAIIAKISKDKLLDSYRSYMKSFGDPQFFIRTSNNELYLTFTKFFSGIGLKVIADQKSADYIIDAIGEFRRLKHPASGDEGVQLSLWIRIYDAKNNQELLSQKNDPTKSAVFYSSGDRQNDIAAEKAFKQMRKPLHEAINKMIGNMAIAGRSVSIIIDNYSDAYSQALEQIFKSLAMVPGCSDLNRKVDAIAQTVTITANYQGKMDDLEMFLRSRMEKDISSPKMIPKTKSIETNQLILNY